MLRYFLNKTAKYAIIYNNVRNQGSQVNLFINGTPATVPRYFTILQALRSNGITIPTFCYHDRLSIAGNCRMCLVEVEKMWKPQVACEVHVAENMNIKTNSLVTRKAQEAVLEFILVDHPLDCPICDQGGECDLQDLSMRFGNDRTRFTDIHFEGKRASESKNLGPLVKTEMTRCIHCTRCIRFASQVCGLEILGSTGRGSHMLVGTYVDKMFLSELSGNVIDLCPVGALTSKPYMFKARSWELKTTNSIDVTDATGTNTVVNHRFDRVLRMLPRENENVNQEWLSDKGRWAIDSLEVQRLVTPMHKNKGRLCPIDWHCGLTMAAKLIKCVQPDKLMAIAGPYCNAETLVAVKDLLNILGCENIHIERDISYSLSNTDLRAAYSLNMKMKDIAKADKILLVGTNPRFEAPILNARIREAYFANECDIYAIGPKCDYNYYVNYIGETYNDIASAKNCLQQAKKPIIIVSVDQLQGPSAATLMHELHKLAAALKVDRGWTVLNILTKEASFAAALEIGWKPGGFTALNSSSPSVLLCLGADNVFFKWIPPVNCTVIYIGFQGDRGAEYSKLVLPGSAYTEAGGTFMNMECRTQFAYPAVTPPGKSRYDWKIIRALAEYCKVCLFYSDQTSLCLRMGQISPNLVCFDTYQEKLFNDLIPGLIKKDKGASKCCSHELNVCMKTLKEYYCSDTFTCNSPTMVKATKAVKQMECSTYGAI